MRSQMKLLLKVAGLLGVLALISTGYCFWLMTVPLSYHLGIRCTDWVCHVDNRICHLVDHFVHPANTIASTASCTECFANQA